MNITQEKTITENYTVDDSLEFDFTPELLARLPTIGELQSLNKKEWQTFIRYNNDSPIKESELICKKMDIPFIYEESLISDLAEAIQANPLGVRGL